MARSQWRSLTCPQRKAWEDFAQKHDPFKDRIRDKSQLARNVYTSCQMQRMTWGDAMRGDAPSVVARYFPDYRALYKKRVWTMFASIDRVYDASKARDRLGFTCRTGFAKILEGLR